MNKRKYWRWKFYFAANHISCVINWYRYFGILFCRKRKRIEFEMNGKKYLCVIKRWPLYRTTYFRIRQKNIRNCPFCSMFFFLLFRHLKAFNCLGNSLKIVIIFLEFFFLLIILCTTIHLQISYVDRTDIKIR